MYAEIRTSVSSNITKTRANTTQGQCGLKRRNIFFCETGRKEIGLVHIQELQFPAFTNMFSQKRGSQAHLLGVKGVDGRKEDASEEYWVYGKTPVWNGESVIWKV